MTPEETEARFQRIEAILAQTAEQNAEQSRLFQQEIAERDRRFAEQNAEQSRLFQQEMAERDRQLADQIAERDERRAVTEEQVELLLLSMNRMTEAAIRYDRLHAEHASYKLENDQRFNTLLEEVRASNRRITTLEN